jgi:hypothetical protein
VFCLKHFFDSNICPEGGKSQYGRDNMTAIIVEFKKNKNKNEANKANEENEAK